MKIGVFGGSFNPPHVCHVMSAAYSLASQNLDKLLVVPCYQHAFSKSLQPFEHRMRMCSLAFDCFGTRVEVSDVERQIGGPSRTVHTLERLGELYPGGRMFLVIGSDILAETDKWYRFDRIRELAELLLIGRGEYGMDQQDPPIPVLPDVSSTDIRRRLASGLSTERLIPTTVANYISEHRLYRTLDPIS